MHSNITATRLFKSMRVFILPAIIVSIFSFPVFSAVNYYSGYNTVAKTTNMSFNYTASTNSNRMLILNVSVLDDGTTYRSFTASYGAQPFTLLYRTTSAPATPDGTGIISETWILADPLSGSHTVSMTSGGSALRIAGVNEYYGVEAVGSYTGVTRNANSLTANLTTTHTMSWIIGFFSGRDGSKMNFSTSDPVTERWNRQNKSGSSDYIHGIEYERTTLTENRCTEKCC